MPLQPSPFHPCSLVCVHCQYMTSHHSPAIVLKGLTHSDLNQSPARCKNVQNSRFFFLPKDVAARSSSSSSISSFQLRRRNVFLADRKCIRIRCIFTYIDTYMTYDPFILNLKMPRDAQLKAQKSDMVSVSWHLKDLRTCPSLMVEL